MQFSGNIGQTLTSFVRDTWRSIDIPLQQQESQFVKHEKNFVITQFQQKLQSQPPHELTYRSHFMQLKTIPSISILPPSCLHLIRHGQYGRFIEIYTRNFIACSGLWDYAPCRNFSKFGVFLGISVNPD